MGMDVFLVSSRINKFDRDEKLRIPYLNRSTLFNTSIVNTRRLQMLKAVHEGQLHTLLAWKMPRCEDKGSEIPFDHHQSPPDSRMHGSLMLLAMLTCWDCVLDSADSSTYRSWIEKCEARKESAHRP